MSSSSTARVFLGLNGAFSVLTGLVLLFMPETIAQMMFSEPGGWKAALLPGLGIGLLIFAAGLVMLASNRFVTGANVMLIVIADIGWIAASAALVIFFGGLFTSNGVLIVWVVAAIVAIFAIGQFVGARRIVAPLARVSFRTRQGSLVATVKRKVDAPVAVVWDVMNDHPGYADVASNLSRVEVLSGDGMGMKRRCYGPKGENWQETCDLYDEGRSYGFRIHTEAPDYPYPFEDLRGLWSVAPSGSGSEFLIELSARAKGNRVARALFVPIARWQFTPVLTDLADAWAARMEREAGNSA